MPEAVPPDPLLKAKRPSVDLPSMAERKETLCFECGQVVGNPPLLNRHEDGESCRRCADRVLDALPSLLPRQVEEEASIDEIVQRMKMFGADGAALFMLDRDLGARSPAADE